MNAKIIRHYLSETDKKYYENNNPGWKVKTSDCLLVTFDDGFATIYVIFEGPWTKPDMCRDCGTYYELGNGYNIHKVKHDI